MRSKLLSVLAALVVASTVFADVVDQTNESQYGKEPKDVKQIIAVQNENNDLLYVYDADSIGKEVFNKSNSMLSDAEKKEMFQRADVAKATAKGVKPLMTFAVEVEGDSKAVKSSESGWWRRGWCGGWCRPWAFAYPMVYYPAVITYAAVSWGWNWGWNNWGCYGGW